jgi:hypothetical protein
VTTAEVVVLLSLGPEVAVSLAQDLEVSLACPYCRRTNRTIGFTLGATSARCNAGSAERDDTEHPPYPGQLVDLDVRRASGGEVAATYRLDYTVSPFDDSKYGPIRRPWSGHPTWARAKYSLTCPSCKRVASTFTQSNLSRPRRDTCTCGFDFYIERREMPLLRWLDPETGDWCQVATRFDAKGPLMGPLP